MLSIPGHFQGKEIYHSLFKESQLLQEKFASIGANFILKSRPCLSRGSLDEESNTYSHKLSLFEKRQKK